MKLKIINPNIIIPCYAHDGDAGLDIFSPLRLKFDANETKKIPLGFALELSRCTAAILKDKSSRAAEGMIVIGGVIDSNYRGEVSLVWHNLNHYKMEFCQNEKLAQMVIVPHCIERIEVVEQLSSSNRGTGGFGSTGKFSTETYQKYATVKNPAKDWVVFLDVKIMDADGWEHHSIEEFNRTPITLADFVSRCNKSTCQYPKDWELICEIAKLSGA